MEPKPVGTFGAALAFSIIGIGADSSMLLLHGFCGVAVVGQVMRAALQAEFEPCILSCLDVYLFWLPRRAAFGVTYLDACGSDYPFCT